MSKSFVFDQANSLRINKARLEHLASLGLDLQNRSVLEVGAGIGSLTSFFEERGCRVVATEVREENVAENRARHPWRTVHQIDLNTPDGHSHLGSFEVIFCYGILYHLPHPELAIADLSRLCTELFLLETCVYPFDNGLINSVSEDVFAVDQSYQGAGCRPARDWIFSELSKHFPFVYVTSSQPDHLEYPTDWNSTPLPQRSRSVFIASRRRLELPTLLAHLPASQTRLSVPTEKTPETVQLLSDILREIETQPGVTTRNIMAEFDLLNGHPWDTHASSDATTYYGCLHRLAASVHPRRIVEIGTAFGMSGATLIHACQPLEQYVTMDLDIFGDQLKFGRGNIDFAQSKLHAWAQRQGIDTKKIQFFKVNTQPAGTDNTNQCVDAPHWSAVPELVALLEAEPFDVLFVDGKHIGDGLYNDIMTFWKFLRPGGLLICDDLHDPAIYKQVFEWAGATLASFTRALQDLAPEIADSAIWNYPRVNTPGPNGLRPFGVIRKKKASSTQQSLAPSVPVTEPVAEIATDPSSLDEMPSFEAVGLLNALARAQQRLFYRDQTERSMATIFKHARSLNPTVIVELGTLSGLSLRTWIAAAPQARIVAVDLSFDSLMASRAQAPLDLSGVTLLKQDIRTLDFASLWGEHDRVLLYVDAHDLPDVPIMDHVLTQAIPALPIGSLLVVDDVWYSSAELKPDTVRPFVDQYLVNEIDPLQCFSGVHASYHKGGSFVGFREVIPLLTWINACQADLVFEAQDKVVAYEKRLHTPATALSPAMSSGDVTYHPFSQCDLTPLTTAVTATGAVKFCTAAEAAYAAGRIPEALSALNQALQLQPESPEIMVGLAICHCRLGDLEAALPLLEKTLDRFDFAGMLYRRASAFLGRPVKAKASFSPGAPLTIFAMPKPFRGHNGVIQRNAIRSWTLMQPRPDIVLLGDEEGTGAIAREFGCRHLPQVERNEFGTPLIDRMLALAESMSVYEHVAYVNSDIILGDDFIAAFNGVQSRFDSFLMIGQRWDADIRTPIDFSQPEWRHTLEDQVRATGKLHAPTGIDYFVFPKGFYGSALPPFALGRTVWDNWLVYHPLASGKPVIDATKVVFAIHQNHDFAHVIGGESGARTGPEAQHNHQLAGPQQLAFTNHATWELTADNILPRPPQTTSVVVTPKPPKGRDRKNFERLAAMLHRLPRQQLPQPEPTKQFQAPGSKHLCRDFMQVHTFYPSYLQEFYALQPHLAVASFDEQIASLVADGFSAIHMFAPYMGKLGYRAQLIVANDQRSQARWLSEQKQSLQPGDDWVREIVRRQIETLKPDILYLSDPITFDGRFLRTLTHKPALVLGWRAAMIPDGTDWSGFDLMLSSLEPLRETAVKLGARRAEHFFPGYPEWMNARITDSRVKHDVVFCGQWSLGLHANRNHCMQALAEAASDPAAPFSLGLYLSGQLNTLTPEVAKHSLPARYGVEMQRALRSGRIAIDARAMHFTRDPISGRALDLAGRQTANMRLFEATGCGVFLLAEHYDNLKDYFELGVEIETFRDESELIEKVRYYLSHPEEREAIARRGQARCLAEYGMERRAAEMDRLICKHLAG